VKHVTSHPAANPNTVILDIDDRTSMMMWIINIYHEVPQRGHALHHLMAHEINDQTPTLLIGDFNTHSPRWSMPGKTLSSWASQLTDWIDDNGLECLNPLHAPTWAGTREGDRPLVTDLVLTNDCARFLGQLSEVDVSFKALLSSDHIAVSITVYPLTSLAIIPPPRPAGYYAEDKARDAWMKEFVMLLPPGLPYALSHCTEPSD
jgi:hypothetical protein